MPRRREFVGLLLSVPLSQSLWTLSFAGTMDEAILDPERNLAAGLAKLLSVLPALQEAISRITLPQERAQFRRGLEQLEREVTDLLRSKRQIIAALANGLLDTNGLRASGERLQSRSLLVQGALAFISPIHYDYVFGPDIESADSAKRDRLRRDFYEMEDLLHRGLDGKGSAAMLLIYAGQPGAFDVPRVVDALRSAEASLVAAQTSIRETLGWLKISTFASHARVASQVTRSK